MRVGLGLLCVLGAGCFVHPVVSTNANLVVKGQDGKTYDLNGMKSAGGKDFQKSVQVGAGIQFMYRISIGESTVADCNGEHGAVTESLVLAGGETCRVLGRVDGMVVEPLNGPNEGVRIKYINGDVCDPITNRKRESWVEIQCDETKKDSPGDLTEMQKTDTCKTVFQMTSYHACSDASSSEDGGGFFANAKTFCWVFFLGLGLYCVLGAAYRYKVHNVRGKDVVPNLTFWEDLPSLVKEGAILSKDKAVFLVAKIRGNADDEGGIPGEEDETTRGDDDDL